MVVGALSTVSTVVPCVLVVYFQGHRAEFHTVQNSSRVRQMAAYPDPPPVVPLPDTGVAQVTTSPGRGLLAEQDRDD